MIATDGDRLPISPLGEEGAEGVTEETEIVMGEEGENESEEALEPQIPPNPILPTAQEVEQHNVTHLPFRNWCPHCVSGKARNRPHKKQKDKVHQVPNIVVDYCFLGGEGDEESLVVQVTRDEASSYLFAHAVPRKGLTRIRGAVELVKDIDRLGYKTIVLKTDNEPAMKTLQEEVKSRMTERTILENSPAGESQSNGVAERAVQAVSEHARVLRSALQNRLGVALGCKHPVIAWLVEHAASCISRYHVGFDGKTAYERVKGKKFHQEIVEFGEKVMYRKGKSTGNKLDCKWEEGIYLGICWRTGGAKVGRADGVLVAHALRRVPIENRWNHKVGPQHQGRTVGVVVQ